MTFQDRAIATALRLITKYGKTISLVRAGVSNYDTATGQNTAAFAAPETVKAIVEDFKPRASDVGLLLKSGDKEITLAASGLAVPTLGDRFVVDNKTYTVVPKSQGGNEVETVYAVELPALYLVHGRLS